MTEQHNIEPARGDRRDFTFTATGGETITLTATYDINWGYEVEPCIGVDEVFSILDVWQRVNAAHRQFLWPSTERDDDDAIIAYLWEGHIVLDGWKIATETDRHSLDDLPALLPQTHFTLIGPFDLEEVGE